MQSPMMTDEQRKIIKDNPIGSRLESFRTSFRSACESADISSSSLLDALHELDQETLRKLGIILLALLEYHPASSLLPSCGSGKSLSSDLSRLSLTVNSNNFSFSRIGPLFRVVLAENPDEDIWTQARNAVTEPTTPPQTVASLVQQTPWVMSTAGITNSSEYRRDVDQLLKTELGVMYDGLEGFLEHFFGKIPGLEETSKIVFNECMKGPEPLFIRNTYTWRNWPRDAKQNAVISWFKDICSKLAALAKDHLPTPTFTRELIAHPDQPIEPTAGRTVKRKMDIGFVDNSNVNSWKHVLIPGELKSNPSADTLSEARLHLSTCVREVFAAQETRRFVIGFTLCGSKLRVWSFDRIGGIGSKQIDINGCGERFVFIILGFLWMSEEDLGFDPTITTDNGRQIVSITRNGRVERLVIDEVMKRAYCIAGRATTCWKAHSEVNPQETLVIKDAWQYAEHPEEGELLRIAKEGNAVRVAKYYHHETVRVDGEVDCILKNVRRGLEVTKAANYKPRYATSCSAHVSRGQSEAIVGLKRKSSLLNAALPPSKRIRSAPPIEESDLPLNRIHRRVILSDYGTPIYKAGSPEALAMALADCIEGHESLLDAGLLHRDISINNLMIGQDGRGFLIDLDLAIKVDRDGVSGAKGKTGTRAFMAIGALMGYQHTFMHDLESFFWVFFWICIHFEKSGRHWFDDVFDQWNFLHVSTLATIKLGTIVHEDFFTTIATNNFTLYYAGCIPLLNKLRKAVFPGGSPLDREERSLYGRMKDILREAASTSAKTSGN